MEDKNKYCHILLIFNWNNYIGDGGCITIYTILHDSYIELYLNKEIALGGDYSSH